MLDISSDKKTIISKLEAGSAYIIQGEAGTGKTFTGILCGQKLLESQKPWQKSLYLTYSKLAKWQIDNTRLKLETKGLISSAQSGRMDIQNFHSLWWDLVCKNCNFLGLPSNLRICLEDEIRQISIDCLKALSKEERKNIIPSYFLKQNDEFNNSAGYFNKLCQALQGEAVLYHQWGAEHFGSRAERLIGEDKFLAWAKGIIEQRNKRGLFSHAETIWWAHQLFLKHPTILSLINAEYPVVIVDEFQDTDVAQWEMLRLLSSKTIIVMFDIKQTIHSWRGASPENRLKEFKAFCSEPERYNNVLECVLTERHRSSKKMSDNENISRAYVKSDDSPQDYLLKVRTLGKCKNLISKSKGKTVGVLCSSNLLADKMTDHLRQSQENRTGEIYSYPINCSRLGAANSPFETVRQIVYELFFLVDDSNKLRLYIANELHWVLLPCAKSYFPKCGSKSKNKEPVWRWRWSGVLSKAICSDFGYGLQLLRKYFIRMERQHGCRCDRALLNCMSHIGKSLQRVGRKWHVYSSQEKRMKVDSLVMQYENAYASNQKGMMVSVMTVHQSKGREFDVVIIPWFNKSKWEPQDSFEWDTSDAEIANLFHTACTRAKKNVFVIPTRELEATWPV